MKTKVYIYGLCNVFYDGYYIQGLNKVYNNYEFNVSKFPKFNEGTFAVILESSTQLSKIIIDSKDSNRINTVELEWCDVYGKVNYSEPNLSIKDREKVIPIGPSFGVKIWNLVETMYYLTSNFIKFRNSISNKREFTANYWRQYKRLELKRYKSMESSVNRVFLLNSLWKLEKETNRNRALFMQMCKNNTEVDFEGGFASRSNGDNLGFDSLVYSNKIPLEVYIHKIKNSAFVFNTPAVLSCHGWKLAEFLALGKAIISTPHCNKLPVDLLNNQHLIYAENEDEFKKGIERLLTDIDFKKKLEKGSKDYFDQYLLPEKVIARLVEKEKK